jgi:hypothetical protein
MIHDRKGNELNSQDIKICEPIAGHDPNWLTLELWYHFLVVYYKYIGKLN